MSQKSGAQRRPDPKGFTDKQGQYLAFIYTYSHMFRRPPAETDNAAPLSGQPTFGPSDGRDARTKRSHSASTWHPQKHRAPRCSGMPANPRMARNQPVKISV